MFVDERNRPHTPTATRPVSRVVAWSALGFTAIGVAAQVILKIALTGEPPQSLDAALYAVLLAYAVVGAFVASHHPRNAVPWIFCGSAALLALGGLFTAYADAHGEPLLSSGPEHVARMVSNVTFVLGFLPLLTFGLLLFPNGRLPSPRWRPFAAFAFVAVSGRAGANVFALGAGTEPWQMALENIVSAAAVLAIIGSAASLGIRFDQAGTIERQQLKFAFIAAALAALSVPAFLALSALGLAPRTGSGIPATVVVLAFATLPVAMSFAILRYRLYDIDVLINRALVYGVTSAGIAVAFFAGIVILQALLRPFTSGNELAVAVSTLASFGLFQPLRSRIQSAVDRRFYRSRYDAERTVDAFSERLRDVVELDALRGDLLTVVGDTMHPVHASLWLRR